MDPNLSTSPDLSSRSTIAPAGHRELCGWGRTRPTGATLVRPAWTTEVEALLPGVHTRGLLARGLGRSYGDAAQNAGGTVVDATGLDGFTLDPVAGTVTADAGVSIDRLLAVLVPRGHFVPVTPGTRFVTVGGAVAADIHGKNHHRSGSWCDHVTDLRVLLPDGSIRQVGPDREPDLFWATAGGMGLTGVILAATFRVPYIPSARLLVDTDRAGDLDSALALMDESDDDYDFSVAWIDLLARGAALGRSVLTRGRFAAADELPRALRAEPHAYEARVLVPAPPWVPYGMLNRLTVRAFNEIWFRKAPARRRDEVQTIAQFFHPLDMIEGWNRLYGDYGFVQYQFVVPFGAEQVLRRIVRRLSDSGCTSFLAVLKRFGPGNPGPLSFPMPGWTLALDIPVGPPGLAGLLDGIDGEVADAGGRVYLAKDGRMRRANFERMYPRLAEWLAVRRAVDPDRVLRSDMGRRLGLS